MAKVVKFITPAPPGNKLKMGWRLRFFRYLTHFTHKSADKCPISECATCAFRDCPSGCDQHYWQDGCPMCWGLDTYGYRTNYQKKEAARAALRSAE